MEKNNQMIEADSTLPEAFMQIIMPKVENFLTDLKSGSLRGLKGRSLSTEAAMEMVHLFSFIIESFRDFENAGILDPEEGGTADFGERSSSFPPLDSPDGESLSSSFTTCGSPTLHMRQQRIPEVEIVSSQVQRLLILIARTSQVLIRPQFGTLLLTNVTRRVLSIVREAAAEARASEVEIEHWHNRSRFDGGSDDAVPEIDKEKSPPEEEEIEEGGGGGAEGSGTFFASSLERGVTGAPLDGLKKPTAEQTSPPLASRPYISSGACSKVGGGAVLYKPPMSPLVVDGEGGGGQHRNNKDFAAPRTVHFSNERANSVQGSGGFHSGSSSVALPTGVLPRTADTQVSVPGQHCLRRAASLREPLSDAYSAWGGATNAAPLHAGSSSPDRVLWSTSTESSRSNSFGTPPRPGDVDKNDQEGIQRFSSCLPSPPPSSTSSSIFTHGAQKTDPNFVRGMERVEEEDSSSLGNGGDVPPSRVVETPGLSVPSSSPFSVAHEFPVRLGDFYENCMAGLEEFATEIDTMTSELCNSVNRQIHRGDVLITIGSTHTLREYLLAASKQQSFRVLLLEGDPTPQAMVCRLAADLAEQKIDVQCLPDSAAFAVMNTCTKVVVGAESVLANGGMLAPIGTRMLCVAARHFSVPVLVPTTTLKMSPYYPSDSLCSRLVRITKGGAHELPWSIYGGPERVLPLPHGMWIDLSAPSRSAAAKSGETRHDSPVHGSHMPLEMKVSFAKNPTRSRLHPHVNSSTHANLQDGGMEMGPRSHVDAASTASEREFAGISLHSSRDSRWGTSLILSQVFVHSSAMEYVPPELVTLYATNESEYTPSQCHRITRANYNDAD